MTTIKLIDDQAEAIIRNELKSAYQYANDDMKPHIDEVIKYYSDPQQAYEWECEKGEI